MDADVRIEHLTAPESLDASDAGPFLAAAQLANTVAREKWGNDDFAESPRAQLARLLDNEYEEQHTFVAVKGSKVAGRALLSLPRHDNLHLGYLQLGVDPDHRRHGIASALEARVQAVAAQNGRSMLCAWADHGASTSDDAGRILTAATGVGGVPADAPATRFALGLGYTLEQVDRVSVMQLAVVHQLPANGPRDPFDMVSWNGNCPQELVAAYATLRARMSTEVPLGGVDLREESWDAARIRAEEELARRRGEQLQVTVARHRTTHELAGHTVLEYSPDRPEVAFQGDTLVLPAHRGHGLGRRLKDHNLALAAAAWPRMQRVYTFNAEENDHMLAINEAMGFARAGVVATWQKQVAIPGGSPVGEQ